ncbi:2-C-methyl-D-erythritol 4-phosphate cytidylyltransferase [Lamprobacter modestohalophilus]|uniref:2-C-methyl-D-erythritol 4-phosphate cytidylyltransferase n=1 Tax=Lamprobacter modestohalophilus TaxID=1064514 RepID=UPI002ADEDAED|nr:2-C-methyl-D-erythritol 4-phosphate cytidylyltransferase [Lamprobacter modestohalophilus]MEA1052011.1 2-C-methyl-D-erythritol 4-phosphate cytidylyltransferase [Lamprobacter modestohalophilus]
MTAGPQHWVVLPAAGAGRRFGGPIPKQYLPLRGRRVIEHSLAVFVQHPLIAGCVIALSPEDEWWQDTAYADHRAVKRVAGGAERSDSVAHALAALAGNAADDDWVLVHDAARPCLTTEDLDRLLAALVDEPVGALLAVPMHDTVKAAEDAFGARVERTLPRQQLWRAYTPQAFRLGQLREALAHCRAQGIAITDDASAIEQLGLRPLLVEGRVDNIKITRPEDLSLAEFFLDQ